MTEDLGASADAETGSREPGLASRPGPTGFDPARDAANSGLTSYPEARVRALAEQATALGIICHIDGFPFGRREG